MAQPSRPKIAVINDDPAFLELINDILEEHGPYEVFTFRDRETSLGELRALHPDLIVIDILVGEQPSGWELALLAGADHQLGPVPIIVSSPDTPGLGRRVEELREVANVRVMSKPFTYDQIRDVVRNALAGSLDPESPSSPDG
ncbi:MAG: response regulator [Candidatus Limnocylindria bacterium]